MSTDIVINPEEPRGGRPDPAFDVIARKKAEYAALSTADLRTRLAETCDRWTDLLVDIAIMWKTITDRGEACKIVFDAELARYIPLIASGEVDATAIVRFRHSPYCRKVVSVLPIDTQRRIAAGEPVKLVVREGDTYTHRLVDPAELEHAEFLQVFDYAGRTVRSEFDQQRYIERQDKLRRVVSARSAGSIRADTARGVIVVGRTQLKPADVVAALAELRSPESEPPAGDGIEVRTRLTPAQKEKLQACATAAKSTVSQVIWNALRNAGLI